MITVLDSMAHAPLDTGGAVGVLAFGKLHCGALRPNHAVSLISWLKLVGVYGKTGFTNGYC